MIGDEISSRTDWQKNSCFALQFSIEDVAKRLIAMHDLGKNDAICYCETHLNCDDSANIGMAVSYQRLIKEAPCSAPNAQCQECDFRQQIHPKFEEQENADAKLVVEPKVIEPT